MKRALVFLDTETTSLRPDRRIWEVGLTRREVGADPVDDMAMSWMVTVDDLDLGNADVASLRIGDFYGRHDEAIARTEFDVMSAVEVMTRDAMIIGAVPHFDTEGLAARMRVNGLCPAWHHRLVDVETLGAGALGVDPGSYSLGDMAREFDVYFDPAVRHTALGDATIVRDLYDAIMVGFVKVYTGEPFDESPN
jgi:DNA polymerase III epsilon subunit-like protein